MGIFFVLFTGFVYATGGTIGWVYWLWLSIQYGSFLMFVFGFLPFTVPISSTIGLWSLVNGSPEWLSKLFG